MNDDDARKAILARRARFIAAAVLSAGIGARCDKQQEPPPMVCLSVAVEQDAGPGPSVCLSPIPSPCLSVAPIEEPPPDAGATIDSGAPPMPCLSQKPHPPPPPRVCLSPPRPKSGQGI